MKVAQMAKIQKHYDKYFKQTDAMVFHPQGETQFHVDVLLYSPTKTFPFWKLATLGASDYAMNGKHYLGNRNEYMMFIDPSVDMKDTSIASRYLDLLHSTALFPLVTNTSITFGHSIDFTEQNDPNVKAVFLDMPFAVNDMDFFTCKYSLFKKAVFLQVIPLDQKALDLLMKLGNEQFSYTYAYPDKGEPHWLSKL